MFKDTSDDFQKIDRPEVRDQNRLLDFRPQGPLCEQHKNPPDTCTLCKYQRRAEAYVPPEKTAKSQTESPAPHGPKSDEPPQKPPCKPELPIEHSHPFQRQTEKIPQCEHGGYVIDGFARCGKCQNVGTTVDSFGVFLESLEGVAGKAASAFQRRDGSKSIHHTRQDMKHDGYLQILMHLRLIMSAKNPCGMAFVVATGRLRDLKKKVSTQREIAVSQITTSEEGDVEEADLDILVQQMYEKNHLDTEGEFFKPRYLRKLESIVEDAMFVLHKEDARALSIIKLNFGFDRDCGALTLGQIGKVYGVSEDAATRARNKGIRRLKELLDKALVTNVRFLHPPAS